MKKNKININIEGENWRIRRICQFTDEGFVQLPYEKGCGLEYRATDEDSWIVMSFFHANKDGDISMDWVREDVFTLNAHDLHIWQKLSRLVLMTYAGFGEDNEDDE